MKNCLFKFSKLLMLFVVLFSISTVNAETVPGSLIMTSYASGNIPVSFPTTFRVKRTSSGKYAYCSYYAKRPPAAGVLYTNHGQITEKGINYILAQSNNARNDGDFFIYQTALWVYMIEQGMMPQPYYDLTVFRSTLYATNTAAANQIKSLVINARNAAPVDMSAPTIKIDNSKAKFTYDSGSKSYVYGPITVASSTGNYNAALNSAPSGSTIKRNGNQMSIIIPSSKITSLTTKITFSVNTSKNVYSAYCYEPNNGLYQNMAVPYVETKTASASKSINFVKNVSIELDKVDEQGKSISGAVLQVTDSKGKVIDSWTSNGQKHKISNLSEGTYTLSEKTAPAGYILTTQGVMFTVNSKGQVLDSNKKVVTLVTLTNKKTTVIISKQDITNKKELPGATLVIKNSSGKEVAKWVSTNKTHVIRGLAVGTYTLTETIAPNGYVLSKETIKFSIDKKGFVYDKNGNPIDKHTVIMYNKPEEKKICMIENGRYYGVNGTEVTEQEYRDQCLKICKIENGKYYGSNGTEVTEQEYRDQCLKICKVENGKYYGSNGTEVTEQEYRDQCLKICKVENGKYYGKNGTEVTEQEYKDQCEKKQTTIISKQDATTGKELPGATLVLKDYEGNVIDTWVSTNETHVIEGLKPGIYTLSETAAPEGYILSTETVTFTVKDDGSVTKVVMYNTPDSKEVPPTPVTPTPVPPTPQEVVVENTASFKTMLSSTIGLALTGIGALILVVSSKKKKIS